MKIFQGLLILLLAAFFTTCKNDLKLNAPYQEIPSIYAVLNPQDQVQMIRVNKVFLGEGDANQMAKVADSVNYQPGELTVTLERTLDGKSAPAENGGSSAKVVTFHDSVITAGAGSFNSTQRVYVTGQKLFTNGVYKLTVKNNKTGNVFTASAKALAPIGEGYRPLTVSPQYPYYPPNTPTVEYVDYSLAGKTTPEEVRHSPNDAMAYELTLRLNYIDSVSFLETHVNYVDYVVGVRTLREVQRLGNLSFIVHTFTDGGIFTAVGNALSRIPNVNAVLGRRMVAIQFIVHTSSQEYLDYMEYVRPSLSINQSKPLYSNFDNRAALGLFTFRTRFSVLKQVSNAYTTAFARNPSTCSYKFYDQFLQQPGCK